LVHPRLDDELAMTRATFLIIGVTTVTVLVGAATYRLLAAPEKPSTSTGAPAGRPIPVTAALVAEKEFPIYRVGLGTVRAYNTVTVKVRVDGEVQKIAFREGQDVEQGDLLAQIDPRPLEAQLRQAEADMARDESLLANAKLDLDRFNALRAREFASRQSVDTQGALVTQYRAAIQRDQAAIDNARVQLGYSAIVSPLAGRTGLRLIDQGNIVHAGDASGLVVVTQIKPITIVFTLPQQFLPEITGAIRGGRLGVLAYDQDNHALLGEGRLELIDNEVDQGTGSARLKAVFPNDDERLWPGEFVNAWLRLAVRRGLVVASQAVQFGPNGTFVFVIRSDMAVEARPVKVAASWQGETLIEDGLAAGERVVIDGQYKLRPGVRVAAIARQAVLSGSASAPGPTSPARTSEP
jgi:multidrug efflux system membrane fusion protein